MGNQKFREVTGIINGRQSTVGTWIKKCVVPSWALDRVSPIIMLEQIGPILIEPGTEDKILPRPRRGYEAVTLLFSGALQHTDSLGNDNLLLAGDVLWLTAGKGIIHSEYRPEEFSRIGGLYHALQIWVNLPKIDKMVEPMCQDIKAAFIPIAESADSNVTIRVISGSLAGTIGLIKTHTPRSNPPCNDKKRKSNDVADSRVIQGSGVYCQWSSAFQERSSVNHRSAGLV